MQDNKTPLPAVSENSQEVSISFALNAALMARDIFFAHHNLLQSITEKSSDKNTLSALRTLSIVGKDYLNKSIDTMTVLELKE